MPNPTIDGVEVASQADLVALQAAVAKLEAAPAATPVDLTPITDRLTKLEAQDLPTAIPTADQVLAALKALLMGSLAAGSVPPTGATSAPVSIPTPPVGSGSGVGSASDKNTYPLVLSAPDATNTQTGGEGPNRIDLYMTSSPYGAAPGMEHATVEISINGHAVVAPMYEVTSMHGESKTMNNHLVLFGPWGPNPEVKIRGVAPVGMNGFWLNGATIDFNDLVYNGVADSRGSKSVNATTLYDSAQVDITLTLPIPVAADSGPVIPVSTQTALAKAVAAASGTLAVPAAVYNESVGFRAPLVLDGGGSVVNPGMPNASYSAKAVLDGAGVGALVQGQAGFVPLSDGVTIKGWEIRNFGLGIPHDGTSGIRNNTPGHFRAEDIYLHACQMGIGPHGPDGSFWNLKNILAVDCGLAGNPSEFGYAHNLYFIADILTIEGGVTSIISPGTTGGHALKQRGLELYISGQNYFYASDSSCIDIPQGTTKPFTIAAGAVIEKKAGDANTILMGYGMEGPSNGNVGGSGQPTFIIPNDGRTYGIATTGPIDFTGAKFLFTDGTPVTAGRINVQTVGGQPQGTVTGLP